MHCPSCREDAAAYVTVPCLDSDGEQMVFAVCRNCDYGINEHTEGVCSCAG
jgi:DNA-directed RNA polymerase subunit M/transcription elongation factor TFIIS